MWPFTKEYKVTYWATDVWTKESIFTVVRAKNLSDVVRKLEKKHYPHRIGIIEIERIG